MVITVLYDDGALDSFDTQCAASSLGASALVSECELKPKDIEADGLWISLHHYDVAEKKPSQSSEQTPRASRRRGWRLLLAAPDEVSKIMEIAIDGSPAIVRFNGELLNVSVVDSLARQFLPKADSLSLAEKISGISAQFANNLISQNLYPAISSISPETQNFAEEIALGLD